MDICLELSRIDHRKCVEALLPRLVEHCAAKSSQNGLDLSLARLGADAVPAACALLDEMDDDARSRLLVWLVSAHESRIRNAVNFHLAKLLGEPSIRVGRFRAEQRPGSRLALAASHVEIDSPALLQSPYVLEGVERLGGENSILKGAAKLALRMGSHLSNENLEKQGAMLLNAAPVKRRLITVLQDAIRQEGLAAEVDDLSAAPGAPFPPLESGGAKPEADPFEKKLMDALAEKAHSLRNADF